MKQLLELCGVKLNKPAKAFVSFCGKKVKLNNIRSFYWTFSGEKSSCLGAGKNVYYHLKRSTKKKNHFRLSKTYQFVSKMTDGRTVVNSITPKQETTKIKNDTAYTNTINVKLIHGVLNREITSEEFFAKAFSTHDAICKTRISSLDDPNTIDYYINSDRGIRAIIREDGNVCSSRERMRMCQYLNGKKTDIIEDYCRIYDIDNGEPNRKAYNVPGNPYPFLSKFPIDYAFQVSEKPGRTMIYFERYLSINPAEPADLHRFEVGFNIAGAIRPMYYISYINVSRFHKDPDSDPDSNELSLVAIARIDVCSNQTNKNFDLSFDHSRMISLVIKTRIVEQDLNVTDRYITTDRLDLTANYQFRMLNNGFSEIELKTYMNIISGIVDVYVSAASLYSIYCSESSIVYQGTSESHNIDYPQDDIRIKYITANKPTKEEYAGYDPQFIGKPMWVYKGDGIYVSVRPNSYIKGCILCDMVVILSQNYNLQCSEKLYTVIGKMVDCINHMEEMDGRDIVSIPKYINANIYSPISQDDRRLYDKVGLAFKVVKGKQYFCRPDIDNALIYTTTDNELYELTMCGSILYGKSFKRSYKYSYTNHDTRVEKSIDFESRSINLMNNVRGIIVNTIKDKYNINIDRIIDLLTVAPTKDQVNVKEPEADIN